MCGAFLPLHWGKLKEPGISSLEAAEKVEVSIDGLADRADKDCDGAAQGTFMVR